MKTLKILSGVVGLLIVITAGLMVSGYGGALFFMAFHSLNKPAGSFDPAMTSPAPDYAQQVNWAALPTMDDPSDLVPEGVVTVEQGNHPTDVFFIHPTGFLTSGSWTSPMDPDSGTEANTQWMMANQASAFNGCCNVYAPRYRESNIFAYFEPDEGREAVMAFAYDDVRRAFEHYIDHHNQGRPFVIASHSQGTHHSMRLLTEVIDTTELHERMVASYLIGSILIPVSPDWFDSLQNIAPCSRADDLHCVVHWDTMPEGGQPMQRSAPSLCTNPLSWRADEEFAERALNEGAVLPVGTFHKAMGRAPDEAAPQVFGTITAPLSEQTSAQCREGSLFAERQTRPEFTAVITEMTGTYHELDYALFYMNIRNNARLRTQTYLETLVHADPSPVM
ncbi:MAG: hypothetical protein CMQ05_14220 [Gammaproteobacteria bacterium]|nr:hypothetical protein [Gammaproteobacteria bacterium]